MQVNMCVSRITVCQPITLALYMTLCNTVTSGTAPAVGEWVLCGLWYGTNGGTVLRVALSHERPAARRKVESGTRAGVCTPLVITLHRLRLSREVKG